MPLPNAEALECGYDQVIGGQVIGAVISFFHSTPVQDFHAQGTLIYMPRDLHGTRKCDVLHILCRMLMKLERNCLRPARKAAAITCVSQCWMCADGTTRRVALDRNTAPSPSASDVQAWLVVEAHGRKPSPKRQTVYHLRGSPHHRKPQGKLVSGPPCQAAATPGCLRVSRACVCRCQRPSESPTPTGVA